MTTISLPISSILDFYCELQASFDELATSPQQDLSSLLHSELSYLSTILANSLNLSLPELAQMAETYAQDLYAPTERNQFAYANT